MVTRYCLVEVVAKAGLNHIGGVMVSVRSNPCQIKQGL